MFHQPPTLHRLFFALLPPPVLARQVAAAAGWFDADGRALPAERLHVALFVLDDLPDRPRGLVAALQAIGRSVDCGPVAVTLDRASGSRRSVALRPAHRHPDLHRLQGDLADAARARRIAMREGYEFAPHMTLGYREGEPFNQPVRPVGWLADELVLIDSHPGRTRHEVLGRWPLVARADAQLTLL